MEPIHSNTSNNLKMAPVISTFSIDNTMKIASKNIYPHSVTYLDCSIGPHLFWTVMWASKHASMDASVHSQTSLTLATSSSYSRGTSRWSQGNREATSPVCPESDKGPSPCWKYSKHGKAAYLNARTTSASSTFVCDQMKHKHTE